jgi:uncharacterized protein YpuA (DUF1002 family)
MTVPLKTGKKKEFTAAAAILRDPARRSRLMNAVDSTIAYKNDIADAQADIKQVREDIVNDVNIDPKQFNAIVTLYAKDNFEEKSKEISTLEDIIHALMQVSGSDSEGNDSEE